MLVLRRLGSSLRTVRPIHSSAALARKAKLVQEQIEELDDDLFSDVEVQASESQRAARRAQIAKGIMDRKADRVGDLRKVLQLSDTPAELEELGQVLQAWRVGGHRVTTQTAKEIVGRCIKLGRADLAEKYASNTLQSKKLKAKLA